VRGVERKRRGGRRRRRGRGERLRGGIALGFIERNFKDRFSVPYKSESTNHHKGIKSRKKNIVT
jgi:hypothetical protein